MNLFTPIVCCFKGHIPINVSIKNDIAIFTKSCERCKKGLGVPSLYKVPPMPIKQ